MELTLPRGMAHAARKPLEALEQWLEAERDQLALWLPVMLGLGIALWFVLPLRQDWIAVLLGAGGLVCAGLALAVGRRTGKVLLWSGLCIGMGCGLVWVRSEIVAAARIEWPLIAAFEARVARIEAQPAKDAQRLLLEDIAGEGAPRRVRVSVDPDHQLAGLVVGERVRVRARLMPPPDAAVPQGYDFARAAWFQGIGATGKALEPIQRVGPASREDPGMRERLSAHVRSRLSGSAGGIAAAFASGDRGGIAPEDEDAMRASGLTHLLSISGLHITAVVAAAMFVTLRLLALSPWMALRMPLLLISAGAGALAGIGYTLLTGAEVPTIRSCIAALLVLGGLALGREAITLRLVATGALIVLMLWPEVLVGASFQLSFAAITAIVALHESPVVKRWTMRRDEGLAMRGARIIFGLFLTGIAVEIALAPIALYHFHKSGLYGALANIVAIPLTTFVIMPLEALALILDLAGVGEPLWWMTGQALDLLLWNARTVAAMPGAMASIPAIPIAAFALMLGGGLWLLLWRSRVRLLGLVPFALAAIWALSAPAPDLLITGDGRHMAIRADDGRVGLLRSRAGDYVRDMLGERSGEAGPLQEIEALPGARCGRDLCLMTISRDGRPWQLVATRSGYRLPWRDFVATCASADIVISDRRLPRGCMPRWLKTDRAFLERTGGLSIALSNPTVETVFRQRDDHPWLRERLNSGGAIPRVYPVPKPDWANNAAAGAAGSPGRAGSSSPRGGNI